MSTCALVHAVNMYYKHIGGVTCFVLDLCVAGWEVWTRKLYSVTGIHLCCWYLMWMKRFWFWFFFVVTAVKQWFSNCSALQLQALGSHLKPALGGCKLNHFFSIPGKNGLEIEPSCGTVWSAARSQGYILSLKLVVIRYWKHFWKLAGGLSECWENCLCRCDMQLSPTLKVDPILIFSAFICKAIWF